MIYLDHAATSFPKPPAVLAAVQRWFSEQGVSASRGDSEACRTIAKAVDAIRHQMAAMCAVPDSRLVFTSGATDSLNTFLDGYLRSGDRVLTTALEHSSLVRPLVHLRQARGIEFDVIPPTGDGRVSPAGFAVALAQRSYRLVAFSHASNVTGAVQDAAEICRLARGHRSTSLLDASQTAGLLDLDVGADVVVASAHKSLLAPPGLGILAVREAVDLPPSRFGGTGSSVAMEQQPSEWPAAMESGTPNTPAILGLGAALEFLESRGRDTILAEELANLDELRTALQDRVTTYSPTAGPRIPVLSFNVHDLDPAEVGMLLAGAGIHVRTGFHCAPWLHEHLGTAAAGTVRVSLGPFSSRTDVLALTKALSA
ncbi:MAG: aminotransferase class V-fold PLP-dependent enzyme [Planctomycetota bacterium]|nr:aminotransferase class V-fold PLP-dependent enzyme [Planctomycetota bacterium]